MKNFHEHEHNETLEKYLDDLLSNDDRTDFEQHHAADELRKDAGADAELTQRLRRAFSPPTSPTVAEIESLLERERAEVRLKRSIVERRGLGVAALLAIAAAAIGLVVLQQLREGDQISPFFEQRPLATIYQEVVDQGFRPYYFCEDQERFARTFEKRQATPLLLADTPIDRRMVGLSYVGGLSRDTTAMLAYVDKQPVVVFVDRIEHDNPQLFLSSARQGVNIFRAQLADLVIYEVTPFDSAIMTPYLRLAAE